MRRLAALISLLLLGSAPALAQIDTPPDVPMDQFRGEFLHDSTTIRFCVDTREPEWRVHRDIASAVADALLLNVDFFEFGYDYAEATTQFEGVPENLLFIFLHDECEAFLGTRMSEFSVHPEWVLTTRPYIATGQVVAGKTQEVLNAERLLDNPEGPQLGIALGSPMNSVISLYFPDTHRRIFPREEHLLEAVLADEVPIGYFYEPRLFALTNGDPGSAGLETAALMQVPATRWQVGMSLSEDRTYIRTLLDQAISELIEDGSIAEILAEHGLSDSLLTEPAVP